MAHCEVSPGIKLYYQDFGTGPAVVFIASAAFTHAMWESQVAALAGDFRTVAYDWRGTGRSDTPRGGYTPEVATADLCALLERLALAPATLVAHGIGTHVATLAATKRPDLVNGIVLASGAPWYGGEHEGVAGGLAKEFIEFIDRKSTRLNSSHSQIS